MAKIKVTQIDDTRQVYFDSLKTGEVFCVNKDTFIKIEGTNIYNAVNIDTGEIGQFYDSDLCTFVHEASLKLVL